MPDAASAQPAGAVHARPVREDDLPGLLALAGQLDSVNLPRDEAALRELIASSQRTCAALMAGASDIPDPHATCTLVAIVAGDRPGAAERLLGTASLLLRHGTPEEPHYFLRVLPQRAVSAQLHAERERTLLRLDHDTVPWTELGGLVVDPAARGQGLGRLLVAARLLLIAMHAPAFCPRLIAELLPALRVPRADGGHSGNAFWDAIGGRLTGLDYRHADRLCRSGDLPHAAQARANPKAFIDELFPHQDLLADLLPPEAQALIGVEGPATTPVRRILSRAGFRYLGTIDPFDAGPHLGVAVSDCAPIQHSRRLVRLDLPPSKPDAALPQLLIGSPATHVFRVLPAEIAGDGLRLSHAHAGRIGLAPGDSAWAMDLGWAQLARG